MAGAQAVSLQVQVIDLEPMTLELMVPTYLPAKDLTQRVARDAGLPVFWPDGRRRLIAKLYLAILQRRRPGHELLALDH